jgi:hypothetical protein
MFRWNDDVSDDAKAAIAAGLDRMAQLDSVAAYAHGPDAGLRDGNWDYVVVADFRSVDDYYEYSADADHQQLITEHIAPNVSARAAVQYDLG